MPTKPSKKRTLHDHLSRLNLKRAEKLLGPDAKHLLREGRQYEVNLAEHVKLGRKRMQVRFPEAIDAKRAAVVSLDLSEHKRERLQIACTPCPQEGELKGAVLGLILEQLEAAQAGYVRLDGKVPQKKRQQLVKTFQNDGDCRFIIMTNAGSTGLNLQAADTVINVDLPWNPAILEQRIARAHRMGQKRPVHVYVLVSEDTLEERLLDTISAKKELANAAINIDSEVERVDMESGIEELKRRLEVLLGSEPDANVDESQQRETEAALQARRSELAASGGQMLSSTFAFLEKLLPLPDSNEAIEAQTALQKQFAEGLSQCVTRDESGRPTLQLTLPDEDSLQNLAASFARFASLTK
jgi:superfamily II DNA/RNA helicase